MSSWVAPAEGTCLLSQVVTRLDFASRDKDSKPEGSGGPAVLGVKCNVCCVPQEERTVGKGQVPVGFLVLQAEFHVSPCDHWTCLCAPDYGTTSGFCLIGFLVVTRLAHG